MVHFLVVAGGGAIGAGGRHLVNLAALRLLGPGFPWGTFIVNVVGCLVMGLMIGGLIRWMPLGSSQTARLFLATGLLGGFTTFSAFSLDFAVIWERGAVLTAIGYAVATVVASIMAVFVGLWLMRWLTS
ncbi:fluoride efflux transporter CrcB [Microbaculum marinum]|uniref:Fluoride-specific ion channel FluC n=1 Tax=Microbaculum marinum TaxID=1764581 RepID=A0AAW9S3K1_9HYPH